MEFSIEAEKPPDVIQMPKDVPQELSGMAPIVFQMPKMIAQSIYANRMVLFLSQQERERMRRKYGYGDEIEAKIDQKDVLSAMIL